MNTVVDVFFPKDVLKISCARGLKKGKKLEDTVPLCQPIVDAIIGMFTGSLYFFFFFFFIVNVF